MPELATSPEKSALLGRTIVTVSIRNLADLFLERAGSLQTSARRAEVECLVDTGAAWLCLKPSVIARLGLHRTGTGEVKTANGPCERGRYDPVQIELMGRIASMDVSDIPEEVPNLLGYIPLEVLDLVVDPKAGRLIGNPEHGGKFAIDVFAAGR